MTKHKILYIVKNKLQILICLSIQIELGQNNTYVKHHDINISINPRKPKIIVYAFLDVPILTFVSINYIVQLL